MVNFKDLTLVNLWKRQPKYLHSYENYTTVDFPPNVCEYLSDHLILL